MGLLGDTIREKGEDTIGKRGRDAIRERDGDTRTGGAVRGARE